MTTTTDKKTPNITLALLHLLEILDDAGGKYRITMPNGVEHTSSKSAKGGKKRAKNPNLNRGEVRAYYAPMLKVLETDKIINVPLGKYTPGDLAGNISAYLSKRLGKGNASMSGRKNAKQVRVYVVKGDAVTEV